MYPSPPPGPLAAPAQPGAAGERSGALLTSGIIAIVVSALWALLALIIFVIAIVVDEFSEDDDLVGMEDVGDAAAGIFFAIAIVILALVAWSIFAAAKMLQRQGWARVATIVNFSIWGLLTLLIAVGTLAGTDDDDTTSTRTSSFDDDSSDSDVGGAVLWFVHAGLCATVVVCAAQRSVTESIRAYESRTMRGTYGFGPPPAFGAPPQAPPRYGPPSGYGPPPGYGQPPQAPPGYGPPPGNAPPSQPPYAPPTEPQRPPAPPLPPRPAPPEPEPPPPSWGAPPR